MVKRRMSTFSRVVAFITAMAMAMLVVTVAHRAVISAEAGMPPEYGDSNSGSAELYSDILALADGDTGTDVDVNEKKCISVQKSEIYLDGSILQPNTNIGDGQKLTLELEWYIPAEKDDDFSGKTFVWDITDEIHGIILDEKTYNVKENGKIIATYKIGSSGGRTIMYITPEKGFDGNHFNKRGSIMLNGVTSVEKIMDGGEGEDPYIKFFEKTVDVKIPKADVYAQKLAGNLRKDGNKYFQEFTVIVRNNGVQTADANKTLLVDKPGSVFIGSPVITESYYDNHNDNENNEVKIDESSDGFEIAVGSLSGHSSVTVKYELEIDASQLFSGSDISVDSRSNTVYVKENPEDQRSPQTVAVDIKKLEPNIGKSGTYDYDNDTITWVISVSPNYFESEAFIVTDTIDISGSYQEHDFVSETLKGASLSNGGKTITISKDMFTPPGDGKANYTFEYKTRVPESVTSKFGVKKFKNNAELKLGGKTYECTATAEKAGKFMTKKFKELNGSVLMWEVAVTVPEGAAFIKVNDRMGSSKYEGADGSTNMFRYSSVSIRGAGANGTVQKDHTLDGNFITGDFCDIWPGSNDITIDIKDKEFLENNSGKRIKIVYGIELLEEYDIDLLSLFNNTAACTITIDGEDPAYDNDRAEYAADVSVKKRSDDNIYGSPIFITGKDEYGGDIYDRDQLSELEKINRTKVIWKIMASFPKGMELGDTVVFDDYFEGDNWDSLIYSRYVTGKDAMTVGLCSNDWGDGFRKLGSGNAVDFNPYTENKIRLTVTINNEDDLDAINNGQYLTLMYLTVMSEEAYTKLNLEEEAQTCTNVVNVKVNNGREYNDKATVTLSPNSRIFDKQQSPINADGGADDGALYTLYVNQDSLTLGASDSKPVITDYIGFNLRLKEDSIKVNNAGISEAGDIRYTYDSENQILTFTGFDNKTPYVITYEVTVFDYLGKDEEVSDEKMQMLYGNKATLSFEGSDGAVNGITDSIRLDNVRGSAEISSETDAMKLNITKKWIGGNAPESIAVKIIGTPTGGGDTVERTVLLENNGTDTWESVELLPSHIDSKPYRYEITELRVSDDFTVSYDKNIIDVNDMTANGDGKYEDSVTITNTYNEPDPEPENISITITKSWVGNGDRKEVTVTIYQDDGIEKKVCETVTLNGGDDGEEWTKTISVPQKSESGTNYIYTAEETVGNNEKYTSSIVPESITANSGTFIVTNTYPEPDPDPEEIEITVIKKWEGDVGHEADRGDKIRVVICQSCEGDEDTVTGVYNVDLSGSADNTWVGEKITVPKFSDDGTTFIYTAGEVEVDNYTSSISPKQISENSGTFTVTNTYNKIPDETDPDETESSVTESGETNSSETDSGVTDPDETKPDETVPNETDPIGTKPSETDPSGTEPSETDPSGTKPSETDPSGTKPSETDPSGTKPSETDPSGTKPSETDPSGTDPIVTEPSGTDPSVTEPIVTEPIGTDPSGSITEAPVITPTAPPIIITDPDIPYYTGTPIIYERPVMPFPPFILEETEPIVTTVFSEEIIDDEPIEYEDVSSAAGIYGDIEEALERDNAMIIILVIIIVIGTSILIYRSKTVDADKKYRM